MLIEILSSVVIGEFIAWSNIPFCPNKDPPTIDIGFAVRAARVVNVTGDIVVWPSVDGTGLAYLKEVLAPRRFRLAFAYLTPYVLNDPFTPFVEPYRKETLPGVGSPYDHTFRIGSFARAHAREHSMRTRVSRECPSVPYSRHGSNSRSVSHNPKGVNG